jgi:hypothetical protein
MTIEVLEESKKKYPNSKKKLYRWLKKERKAL